MSQNFIPRAVATVGGFFVPSGEITVEQTAYGNADVIRISTYAAGNYDWGRISQKFMPTWVKVNMGPQRDANDVGSMAQLIEGILDEVDVTCDTDEVELRGRGMLALLIDKRITVEPYKNMTVDGAIKKIIESVGLKAQVTASGIRVGRLLNEQDTSMNRNLKALDVIQSLAWGTGFRIRTQGRTVIVGPPPSGKSAFVLERKWGHGDRSGEKLHFTHSALHAHGVKVRVIAYVASTKTTHSTSDPDAKALADSLGLPASANPTGRAKSKGAGLHSASGGGVTENPNSQEYVIIAPGKSMAELEQIKENEERKIARKEFKMQYVFSPTADELIQLVKNSPEFLINMTGTPMPSCDGLYHPERIIWKWVVGKDSSGGTAVGLTIEFNGVNHDIPVPSGGLPNTNVPA